MMTRKFPIPTAKTAAFFEPVLDWLENYKHTEEVSPRGFNMGVFVVSMDSMHHTTKRKGFHDYSEHVCGTVCCIAGAVYLGNKDMFSEEAYVEDVGKVVGLTEEQSQALFYARENSSHPIGTLLDNEDDPHVDEEHSSFSRISPQRAAKTIRHMLNTGKVDWHVK